jgi:hypothetical protein
VSDTAAAKTGDASAAGAEGQEQDAGDEKQEAAVVKPTGPDPTVDVLMALRADLLEAAEAAGLPAGGVEVLFQVPSLLPSTLICVCSLGQLFLQTGLQKR